MLSVYVPDWPEVTVELEGATSKLKSGIRTWSGTVAVCVPLVPTTWKFNVSAFSGERLLTVSVLL